MRIKRLIAMLLTVVLMLSAVNPAVYAAEDSNVVSETNTETQVTETVEDTSLTNELSDIQESEQPASEDKNTVVEESESTIQTEESYPAQDFSKVLNDNATTVSIKAPEGAFPSATEMTVENAPDADVKAAAKFVNVNESNVKAYEITFTADNSEVEPNKEVEVTITDVMVAATKKLVVIHVDDENNATEVKDVTIKDNTVTFKADAFSTYALVSNDTMEVEENDTVTTLDADDSARNYVVSINYVFENNTQAAQTWSASLAKGTTYSNTIKHPTIVGYEPTVTTLPEGVTNVDGGLKLDLTISGDVTINVVYVPATVNYTVKYYQQNVDDDNYTLAETVTKTGKTESKIGVSYESEKNHFSGFYGLRFNEDVAIAADGSTEVEIYYDRNYYMVSFDLDGGYGVEPIYARYGTPITVGTPSKSGHTFSAWDKEITATVPAENVTYKALWNAKSVNFTVVFWYENADDADYSYAGSITATGYAGATVNSVTYRSTNFAGRDATHFTYNASKAESKNVAGDGSTVLNVYFTRNVYTLTFKSSNQRTTYGTITAKYQAYIADQWPLAGSRMSGSNNQVPTNFRWWRLNNSTTFTTKRHTMAEDLCNNNGIVLRAELDNSLSTYKVEYYFESLKDNGTYELSPYGTGFSQTVLSDAWTSWNYKIIDGFNPKGSGNISPDRNKVYKLYYTRNRNIITFNDNHGTITAEILNVMYEMPLSNVKYNNKAIADIVPDYPTDLEPGAYRFGGWYTTAGCYDGTEANFETATMPNANLIFYAKWIPVTHTVTTYLDNTKSNQLKEEEVSHGSLAAAPDQPENKPYEFIGWFYEENGKEKAFDFDSMGVTKDLEIYAKWSSNVLVDYTVNYQLADGTPIGTPTTGSALAGTTKTFEAKTEDQLNEGYQSGYYPLVSSHSIFMDIHGGDANVYTFVYKPAEKVPYTVKYLEKDTNLALHEEKVVVDNTHAVVTEKAETISGYLPDVYQQRLILTVPADGEPTADDNVLIFYYTKDDTHAIVSTTYHLIDGAIDTEYRHNEEIGEIGEKYTAEKIAIKNYTLSYVEINGTKLSTVPEKISATLTNAGLQFDLYYTPNYFYVYHSHNQSVEKIFVPEDGSTFDITKKVADGYLYGGYYSAYKKVGSYAGGATATYDGTNYAGATAGYWDSKKAYTNDGRVMTPEIGKTYYLKEVPSSYFKPTMALVYDSYAQPNMAKKLYLISATDDKNYTDFGLEFTGNGSIKDEKKYTSSFRVQEKINVNKYTTVTAKTAFNVKAGYLGVWNATETLIEQNMITYRPYVVTPDGVTVYGTTVRTVCMDDLTYHGNLDKIDGERGVYRVDN